MDYSNLGLFCEFVIVVCPFGGTKGLLMEHFGCLWFVDKRFSSSLTKRPFYRESLDLRFV